MNARLCAFALSCSLLLLHAKNASGQEIEVEVNGQREHGRANAEKFDATRLTSEASKDDVKSTAAQSTPDALRYNALVSIQQTTPGQGTVYVRGFSGRGVGHSVDGVRLNTATFRAGNNPHLGLVDPYAIEHFVVVPGASSVEHGSDALGGSLSLHTPLPGYSLGGGSSSLQAFQSLSTNPLGTASRLDATTMGSTLAFAAGFTYLQAGPVTPGQGLRSPIPESYRWLERDPNAAYAPDLSREQVGTEFDFYACNATLRGKIGRRLQAVVRAQHSVRPELLRYDQITPRFKNDAPARAEDRLAPLTRTMASLELIQRLRSDWLESARLLFGWQRIFERTLARRFDEACIVSGLATEQGPADCTGVIRLTPQSVRTREETISNAFTLRGVIGSATNENATAELGLELHGDTISTNAEEHDLLTGTTNEAAARYADGSFLGEAGVFGRMRYSPTPNLTLTAGARGGLFALHVAARPAPNATPDYQRTLADYAAELGVRYALNEAVAVVANCGRGFRSPNVEDLSALGSRRQGRYQVPNHHLRPEHSYTADVGLKTTSGSLSFQTALFFGRYEDAIVLGPTTLEGQASTSDGDAYYHSVNAGRVDYHGVESQFSLPVGSSVALFGRWLSMLGTQYGGEGSDLPQETPADRVPPQQAELGVRGKFSPALSAELFGSWRAAQQRLNDPINLDDNRIPEGGTPGYLSLHVRAAYAASSQVKYRLALDNLTDQLVLEHGSGFYRAGFGATASIELSTDP